MAVTHGTDVPAHGMDVPAHGRGHDREPGGGAVASIIDIDQVREATEHGSVCALAADCQRDLQKCDDAYPGLFPRPFDARLFSTTALANAFGSPWSTASELRVATRSSLWVFAADWLVDYAAKTRAEVTELAEGCLAVADGAPPVAGAEVTRFLADIRDELATVPAFDRLHPVWYDQLRRYLDAVTREWDWKTARAAHGDAELPTFEQYLDNHDNFGSAFVNVSHWIFTGDAYTHEHLDELRVPSGLVQRVLRLLNDLATYGRDRDWGDLNALMLGVGRAEVAERIGRLVDQCRTRIEPLRAESPRLAAYLERQIGYSTGFYGKTDYWGSL